MDVDFKNTRLFVDRFYENIDEDVSVQRFKTFLKQFRPIIQSGILQFFDFYPEGTEGLSDAGLFDKNQQFLALEAKTYTAPASAQRSFVEKKNALKDAYSELPEDIAIPNEYTEQQSPLKLPMASKIWKSMCVGIQPRYVYFLTRIQTDVTIGIMGKNNKDVQAVIFYTPTKNPDGTLNHVELLLVCADPGFGRTIVDKFHEKLKATYPGQKIEVRLSSLNEAKGFHEKMGYMETGEVDKDNLRIMKKVLGGRGKTRRRRTRKSLH